jgi:hypothetical protein
MRVLTAFLLGAMLAGTVAYFVANHNETAQIATPQPVRQEVVKPADAAPPDAAPPRDQTPAPPAVAKPKAKRKPEPFKFVPKSAPAAPLEVPEPPVVNGDVTMPVHSTSFVSREALPPPEPHKVTLNAGTLLTVRLAEEVSSEKHESGETFAATLDQPLVVDGFVIAEKGSRAEGKIVTAERSGRVKGIAGLQIQLTRLNTSDGQKIEITTDAFEKKAESGKSGDIAKVGAAAAIGAAIGAALGGGKGAAVGGAAGGAAGAGTVLGTRGKAVTLPSETRLTFRLAEPVTITERL